ncbi:MAG: lipopolysaccharide assembly protein LapA domain-containing protein [Chloroflexota bacterium]
MAAVLTLILLVAVAIFAVENAGAVALRFAVWTFNSSLVYVVLGALVAGMLAASIFWSGKLLAMRRRLRELDLRARRADADLAALRNPLAAGTAADGHTQSHGAKSATPGGI